MPTLRALSAYSTGDESRDIPHDSGTNGTTKSSALSVILKREFYARLEEEDGPSTLEEPHIPHGKNSMLGLRSGFSHHSDIPSHYTR